MSDFTLVYPRPEVVRVLWIFVFKLIMSLQGNTIYKSPPWPRSIALMLSISNQEKNPKSSASPVGLSEKPVLTSLKRFRHMVMGPEKN